MHLGINMTSSTAQSGTVTCWSNETNLSDSEEDIYKAFTNAKVNNGFTTTNVNGNSYAGFYYNSYGTAPATPTSSMAKYSVTFRYKYSNGAYYQVPYLMAKAESSNSNTYYMRYNTSNNGVNKFKLVQLGDDTDPGNEIEGLIWIPWYNTALSNRHCANAIIRLYNKEDELIKEYTTNATSYRGWYITTDDIKEIVSP